jgi:hypothetical protein
MAANVSELRANSTLREQMAQASRALGRPDAAKDIARMALELGAGKSG